MKKACTIIFLLSFALLAQGTEKLFLLAEDGFVEFLKQDFHKLAQSLSYRYDCKLSSKPEPGVKPVLRIGKVKESGDYESVLIAVRGYLFFANDENPVEDLSAAEVKKIFSGTFRRWSRTNVPLRQICYSGSEQLVPVALEVTTGWIRCPARIALQMVADDLTALGIIPLTDAALSVKGTKLLTVDGVAATPENVMNGTYPAATKYYLSIRKDAPPEVRKIYQKLSSRQTKNKLLNAGILPVTKGD